MKFYLLTFIACVQMAFAGGDTQCMSCEKFILGEGERLEATSKNITIQSDEKIEIRGEIVAEGEIFLVSSKGIELFEGGVIEAPSSILNAGEGELTLRGGIVFPEGEVRLIGDAISIEEGAVIDVSSETGGGKVYIGGGFHGKDPTIPNAKRTYIGRGASILADSFEEGSGGEVVIWSDEDTVFLGMISACAQGIGNGGKIEVSGKEKYIFQGDVFHSAKNGKSGTLLLDPKTASIFSAGTDPATGNTFAFKPDEIVVISGASLATALEGGDVTIQANTDIIFNDSVTVTSGANSLTLEAGRSVAFHPFHTLTLNGGSLIVVINDANVFSQSDRDSGVAQYTMMNGSAILTNGGDITIAVGSYNGAQEGVIFIETAMMDAAGGNIHCTGFGAMSANSGSGITIGGPSQFITTGNGSLTLNGIGAHEASYCSGIQCAGLSSLPAKFSTENGPIVFNGTGGGNGSGQMNVGIRLWGAVLEATGTGEIQMVGIGGSGNKQNVGVLLSGVGAKASVVDGNMSIQGTGGGNGTTDSGVRMEGGAEFYSSGNGTITVNGVSGGTTDCNSGVILSSSPTAITSVSGDITVTGVANGSKTLNQGIRLESGAAIQSLDTAEIILNGTGSFGTDNDNGVAVIGSKSTITGVDGDIDITGTSHATGINSQPILIEYPNNVYTTGTGQVILNPL